MINIKTVYSSKGLVHLYTIDSVWEMCKKYVKIYRNL